MSYARGFGLNGKSFYTNVAKPCVVNVNFTVDSTNANGLGVKAVKSNGFVENVFMHTTQTPGKNNGFTNPNPANGFALVQLKQNFNYFIGLRGAFVTPTATSTKIDNSALTVGQVYVISTLGNATLANWVQIGVPVGITPALGVVFVAAAVGVTGEANTSTSRVMLPTTSGISSMEVVGDPNTMVTSNPFSNAGQLVMIQFNGSTVSLGAYTPAGTVAAPTFTGTVLGNHVHDMLYKNAAVADGATTRVNVGANLLGANTGGDLTVTGNGANGGMRNASAGTPAGTNSAPAFTGTPATLTGTSTNAATAPADASVCSLSLWFDGSSVTIDGL